jgi:CRP/FNR family transcriptional regulator, cyclic AMP receptor protein
VNNGTVAVLDSDPDLGERLKPAEREEARRALTAETISIEPGPWNPAETWTRANAPSVGLLLCDGLVTREVVVAGRPSSELLGPSDLLRPWDQDGDIGLMPVDVNWQILAQADMVVLDRRFLLAAARWPVIIESLLGRTLRRARWLAFQVGMKQITRIEGRVLVLFWALSERWGVVTPRGVHVKLRLTHEAIGRLVGARRPSVTTALGALAEAGAIERQRDGYLLFGDAEQAMRRAAGELD